MPEDENEGDAENAALRVGEGLIDVDLLTDTDGVKLPDETTDREREGAFEVDVEGSTEREGVCEVDTDGDPRGLPLLDADGRTDGVPAEELEELALKEGEAESVCVALRRPIVALTEGEGESREPVGTGEPLLVLLEEGETEAHAETEGDTDGERDTAAAEGVAHASEAEALGEAERECSGEGVCDGEPLDDAVREAPDALPPNRDAVGDTLAERDTDTDAVLDRDCDGQ